MSSLFSFLNSVSVFGAWRKVPYCSESRETISTKMYVEVPENRWKFLYLWSTCQVGVRVFSLRNLATPCRDNPNSYDSGIFPCFQRDLRDQSNSRQFTCDTQKPGNLRDRVLHEVLLSDLGVRREAKNRDRCSGSSDPGASVSVSVLSLWFDTKRVPLGRALLSNTFWCHSRNGLLSSGNSSELHQSSARKGQRLRTELRLRNRSKSCK